MSMLTIHKPVESSRNWLTIGLGITAAMSIALSGVLPLFTR